ncbi:MAG: acyl-CoA dehydrogenase family protein [Solirubrobacterales bacterium]|nr:acyl-CoA dehydrogenase family protein [Solirubrobacterales bacterium]OJU95798.1 MAG: acyl-CoA dehydrogenase [Solirubrobacterales bacterium 67-14]
MDRAIFEPEHQDFRETVRRFVSDEIMPNFEQWETDAIVPRELFQKAGEKNMLAMSVSEEYGGLGLKDFRFNQIIGEEGYYQGATGAMLGITLHNDVCLPYFEEYCNDEQKERWLPGIVDGSLITAVAMTEPGIGSDLASMSTKAILNDDHYVVDGSKTFITNGINADLIITAVKTDPKEKHRGMSIVIIERGMDGFERGRNLEKVGMHSQDTAELFFNEVKVPVENRLGNEGDGFKYLVSNLAQERMSIACAAIASATAAMNWTLDYVKERYAFGTPIGSFQNSRFQMAEIKTEVDIGTVFIDKCVEQLNAGKLTVEDAAEAKWWATEMADRVIDKCVQLHGGYGYMLEYPIARAYADNRVTRIYGGTTEIMKEIVGRSLGL